MNELRILATCYALLLTASISLTAGERIDCKSPDGKFAPRETLQPTEWTRNGGDFSEGSETITIVFDAEHKVSIQLGISAGVLETN